MKLIPGLLLLLVANCSGAIDSEEVYTEEMLLPPGCQYGDVVGSCQIDPPEECPPSLGLWNIETSECVYFECPENPALTCDECPEPSVEACAT